MAGGRPSTYPDTEEEESALCERIVALGSEGLSEVQISARINTPRTTIRSWADQHPRFSSALTRARELSQVWWEDKAQGNLENRDFNASLWHKNVASRFRDEYGERVQHTGDPANPIQHNVGISWMTEAQAKARGWA